MEKEILLEKTDKGVREKESLNIISIDDFAQKFLSDSNGDYESRNATYNTLKSFSRYLGKDGNVGLLAKCWNVLSQLENKEREGFIKTCKDLSDFYTESFSSVDDTQIMESFELYEELVNKIRKNHSDPLQKPFVDIYEWSLDELREVFSKKFKS